MKIRKVVKTDRKGDVADLAMAGLLMEQELAGRQQALLEDKFRESRPRGREHALRLWSAEAIRPGDGLNCQIRLVEISERVGFHQFQPRHRETALPDQVL